ncbi:hypothetical protein LZ554_005067 [Drepanopeziza brunnea f. sp. 'monogermtubi']|nr:hypothetical protein LZ554_005067 [Drepanopeziza brunnea f. sp. 'monogermtubi']
MKAGETNAEGSSLGIDTTCISWLTGSFRLSLGGVIKYNNRGTIPLRSFSLFLFCSSPYQSSQPESKPRMEHLKRKGAKTKSRFGKQPRFRHQKTEKAISGSSLEVFAKPEREIPSPPSFLVERVPLELQQQIADLLPPSSAIALSLTRKRLWVSLQRPHHICEICTAGEKQSLLSLLARDLADHENCITCLRLHPPRHWWMPKRPFLPCSSSSARGEDDKRAIVRAAAFRMASRERNQTPECTKYWKLQSSKVAMIEEQGYDYLRQSQGEYQVVNGRVMHREQTVVIRYTQRGPFQIPQGFLFGFEFMHCRHNYDMARAVFESKLPTFNDKWHCEPCRTRWTVSRRFYQGEKEYGKVLFCTRWRDFGNGCESVVPPRYLLPSFPLFWEQKPRVQDLDSAFGDPPSVFRFDSLLTPRNKTALLRARKLFFEFDVTRRGGGRW